MTLHLLEYCRLSNISDAKNQYTETVNKKQNASYYSSAYLDMKFDIIDFILNLTFDLLKY